MVADLTGHNPNVFYELAIRHAIRKPVVQIIQKGETIPFDVAQNRTIEVDYRDLDSVADCRKKLVEQIHMVEDDPTAVDSPISLAVDVQALRESGNPLEKSNAEIISMLQELRTQVRELTTNRARMVNWYNGQAFVPWSPYFVASSDEVTRDLHNHLAGGWLHDLTMRPDLKTLIQDRDVGPDDDNNDQQSANDQGD